MEWVNFIGLMLIAATNGWIAVQIRNQKTYNQITVEPAEICYDSLATAMENSWPTVTVENETKLDIDYDRLAEALTKVQIQQPTPTPTYPSGPWWQQPISKSESFTSDADFPTTTINGIPVKTFPVRREDSG